jgi:FkbM family methyltransferase
MNSSRTREDASGQLRRFTSALANNPADTEALLGSGVACIKLQRYAEAKQLLQRALEANGDSRRVCYALSLLHREQEDYAGERKMLDEALRLYPQDARLRGASGASHLLHRNWREGWADCAFRDSLLKSFPASQNIERWRGEDMGKRTLLVHVDGTASDSILFSGYLQEAVSRGIDSIVLNAEPALARFLARLGLTAMTSNPEVERVVSGSPDGFRRTRLVDLPRLLELPIPVPSAEYAPASDESEKFGLLFQNTSGLKVGLCWDGSGARRGTDFDDALERLLGTPDCSFYGFLCGESPLPRGRLFDVAAHCHDLADVAAALVHVDLVIALSGLPMHAAAAMRKPVVLLSERPWDWRWGSGEDTCPWYPTMQILRQDQRSSWAGVVQTAIAIVKAAPHRRTLAWRIPVEPDPLTTKPCRYGNMCFYTTDHYVGRSLELYGEFSELEADLYRHLLAPGDTVIEAGANIGSLTSALAGMVGPHGRVHAFEPQRDLFELLKRNAAHLRQVTAWPHALASVTGTVEYHPQNRSKVCNPGGCQVAARSGDADCESVDAVRADDVLPSGPVHLIKADVEGAELEVLKGTAGIIARCRPVLYVEDDRLEHRRALHDWVSARGYKLYRHTPPLFNPDNWAKNPVNVFGEVVSINLLCMPEEKQDLVPALKNVRPVGSRRFA